MPTISADDVETAIQNPAPGQIGLFLDFEWLVPMADGQAWGLYSTPPFTTDYIFTRPQRFEPLLADNQRGKEYEANPHPLTTPDGWNLIRPMRYLPALESCRLERVPGREIFKRVLQRGDYHTIHVNSGCGAFREPYLNGELRMPCGWTPLWLEGIDPRPGARVAPARSVAEIHLYMQQMHMVRDPAHRLEYIDGELAAVYFGPDINGNHKQQAFTPVKGQPDPRDFGPGVSEILCGGMIAHMLDSSRSTLEHNFHEGTRTHLREHTPDIIRKIDEALKMIDRATGQLPPHCFRAEFAPTFIRHKPHVIGEHWLRESRQRFVAFEGERGA